MTGVLGLSLFLVVTGVVLWAVGIPAAREADQREAARQAADTVPDVCAPGADCGPGCECRTANLAAQLGASFDNRPPWQPRISAGRVTVGNRIRWAYALADYPVPGYSWALSTTAQEAAP